MKRLIRLTAARLQRAWLGAIRHIRDENPVGALADRLHHWDPVFGLDAAAGSYAAAAHASYTGAGQVAARKLELQHHTGAVPVGKKLLHFDGADPVAEAWARQNRLDKVAEITQDQRETIQRVLLEGTRRGDAPGVIAREIRASLGLTEYQVGLVANYRRALETGQLSAALGRELRDGRYDRALEAAIRDARALEPAQIDRMVEAYRRNWIAQRAEMLATTEATRIAHQGTEELYRQAIARGDLQAEDLDRTWHWAPGRKSFRPSHRALHGKTQAWGEVWQPPGGSPLRYPGDPEASADEVCGCCCTLETTVRSASSGMATPVAQDEDALAAEADAADEELAAQEEDALAQEMGAADEDAYDELTITPGEEPREAIAPTLESPESATAEPIEPPPAEIATEPAATADMLAALESEIAEARAAFDDYEAEAGTRLFERLSATAERLQERAASMTTDEQAKLQALNRSVNGLRFRANNEPVRAPAAPEAVRLKEYNDLAAEYAARLTPDQRYAITNYSNHTDKILNPMLRAGEVVPDADLYSGDDVPAHVHELRRGKRNALQTTPATVGAEMAELDAAIEQAPLARDVELYRVMSDPNAAFLGDLEEGSVFADRGYVSTATNVNYLDDFYQGEADDRVDMFLNLKKGQFAAPLGDLSDFKSEREMLLPRGSRFRVQRIEPATPERAKRVYLEML